MGSSAGSKQENEKVHKIGGVSRYVQAYLLELTSGRWIDSIGRYVGTMRESYRPSVATSTMPITSK